MEFFKCTTCKNTKTHHSAAGFTLIELMVYIALLGGIVLIAGQAFSDSAKMRIRTQSMLQANQTAGNVATILKEDITQLGAKSAIYQDGNADGSTQDLLVINYKNKIYMDSTSDSSSFIIEKNDGGADLDKITMRRMRYSATGKYEAVEEVSWFVENSTLKRSCKSIDAITIDENCPDTKIVVDIAGNIDRFKLTPAKPSVYNASAASTNILPSESESEKNFKFVSRFGDENYDALNISPANGGNVVRLSGFAMNYDFEAGQPITNPSLIKANQVFLAPTGSAGSEASWKSLCKTVTLKPNIEYEISFSMPFIENDPSRMFCPGRDHMAVGFRYTESGKRPHQINDFQFYPPTSDDSKDTGFRTMRFTVGDTIKNVCLGFTFISFSPVASTGNVNFTNIKLKQILGSTYSFVDGYNPEASDDTKKTKKNIKAIKLELSLNQNGESGSETTIIAIPSNGPRD